jgi:negative regulator of flagellin synthesis FlgM
MDLRARYAVSWRKHVRINPNPSLPEGQPTDRVGAAGSSTQSNSAQSTRAASPDTTDRANLSSDALQLSNLSSTLANVPEIRSGRVAAVQQAVQNGNYAVSNQQIAQSLLRDFRIAGATGQ